MIRKGMENNRGFVLLVALGVLGVLGLLAATFATLSRVERAVSNSYVDKVRAKMLAQSGVERAIASIRGRAMIQSWDDQRNDWYYREMLNVETGTLVYPAIVKTDLWKFVPTRAYGMPPRSLESALDDGLVNGVANGISFPQALSPSANEPFSGQFPGTYENRGDVYALKVLDCASMINVNDGGKNTVRMLNALGSILKCADGSLVSTGGFNLGDQISTKAIARGKPFNNKSEVLDAVFINNTFFAGNATEARKRFSAVQNFITTHGWIDGMTMKFENTWGKGPASNYQGGSWASAISSTNEAPSDSKYADSGSEPVEVAAAIDPADTKLASVPMSVECTTNPLYMIAANVPGAYASLPATRLLAAPGPVMVKDVAKGGAFKQFVTGQGLSIPLAGETKAGKFGGSYYLGEPRTPINVNTAPKEVLVATMMNLAADFWDYAVVSESPSPAILNFNARLEVFPVVITQADAEKMADFIISARFTNGSPAGAWSYNDWMHFEDDVLLAMTMGASAIPGITRWQTALVKANANPNSNIKKYNPDLILVTSHPQVNPDRLVRMDKSDIKVNSTEWTFSSNGLFEIESIGRVYNAGKIMAEEKIETVVKVFDQVVYTTQEQLEKDRIWTVEDSKEGDLLAGGYPPVVSMPEYLYNTKTNPIHYRSQTGDVTWCADYEGYMILNGPVNIVSGITPGPAANGAGGYGTGDPNKACWGPDPHGLNADGGKEITGLPAPPVAPNPTVCAVSFVAGFNLASLYPNQSHRNAWHDGASGGAGGPRHPEYSYTSPHCFGDGVSMSASPLNSFTQDTGYLSASYSPKQPYQMLPTGSGADFWDGGCDMTNFGVYMNTTRRNRFHTYWADEVPSPNVTIEMTVKPEIDLWNWAKGSQPHDMAGWMGTYQIFACKRQFLFDWGTGGTQGMNYTVRGYVQNSKVFLEMYCHTNLSFYIIWADNYWKPHTWHHVEWTWVSGHEQLIGGVMVPVPPNAMLFVDGTPASEANTDVWGGSGSKSFVNTVTGVGVYPAGVAALVLPENVAPTNPNNDVGTGPRFDVGGILANDGAYGMSSPRWHGTIDNVVMHHWRSHAAAFTPRNRYHSMTYYDGSTWKSGEGYKKEKAGVYKKRLTYLEGVAATKDVTIGTVACTHYHPFHVHLYGHDGSAPTTSFGHITPSLRIKTGGSYVDAYYYDGCVGVPVKTQLKAGSEVYYLGWFEIAALVPVTMSPILCDIKVTYFEEPQTLYRLSSSEAKK